MALLDARLRRRAAGLAAALALLAPGCAPRADAVSVPPPAPEVRESLEDAAARVLAAARRVPAGADHWRTLVHDVGPRPSSSEALEGALGEVRDQWLRDGLDARLEWWGELAVGWEPGPVFARRFAPGDPVDGAELEAGTWAWTPGTDGTRRGALALGPRSDDAADPERFADRWVLARERSRSSSRQRAMDRVLGRALGEVVAAAGEEMPRGGNFRLDSDDLPETPRIVLRASDHADLRRRLERGERVELEVDARGRFRDRPVALRNVVADLRGAELADELVIVGARLDTWGRPEDATDGAAGAAAVIEAARLLAVAGVRPRRTIRFVLFTGELLGSLGSKAYVRENARAIEGASVLFVHPGGPGVPRRLEVTPAMEPTMRAALAPLLELPLADGLELAVVDGLAGRPTGPRASFARTGVPVLEWELGPPSPALSVDIEETAIALALAALGVAEAPERLDRTGLRPPRPRKMGVYMGRERPNLRAVLSGSRAERAGWERGDVIVRIDGEDVHTPEDVVAALQRGGPRKAVVLERDGELVETVLDFSDDPDEPRRTLRSDR